MIQKSVSEKVYQNPGNPEALRWVPAAAQTVLDVGCGAGDNARLLQQQGKIVDGITLSLDEMTRAQPYLRHVWRHNLEQGLPSEVAPDAYDCILCVHVLEHICFPDSLLHDLKRSLKPGGVLIVALPNLLYYKYRLRLLLGKFEYEPEGVMDNTHFRWYTYTSAQKLLTGAGFRLTHVYADGFFPFSKVRWFIPVHIRTPLDRWASKRFPGLFGYQLIFIGTK